MRNLFIFSILILAFNNCKRDSGFQVTYYKNGDTLSIYEIHKNLKNGIFKVFFQDGTLRQEGYFKNGMKNGIFKTYFESGDLSEYFVYKNDTLIYLTDFNEKGQVIGSALGIKISKEPRNKRVYYLGDTIHFGYELIHSMVENPIIGLDIVRFSENGPDTIESVFQESRSIEYDQSIKISSSL